MIRVECSGDCVELMSERCPEMPRGCLLSRVQCLLSDCFESVAKRRMSVPLCFCFRFINKSPLGECRKGVGEECP